MQKVQIAISRVVKSSPYKTYSTSYKAQRRKILTLIVIGCYTLAFFQR